MVVKSLKIETFINHLTIQPYSHLINYFPLKKEFSKKNLVFQKRSPYLCLTVLDYFTS